MNWLLFLVLAYFLLALAALTDKFVLAKAVSEPVVYLLIVSTLGLIALVLIPFGFSIPDFGSLLGSLLAGILFTFSVFFLYKSVQLNEASIVFPLVGSLQAIFIFILSFLFLGERLSLMQLVAFFILVIGGALISLEFNKKQLFKTGLSLAVFSGFLFAAAYTATKFVYSNHPFISGLIWIRIFSFIAALGFLLNKKNWQLVKDNFKKRSPIRKRSNQLVILAGQASAGLGIFLINYVVSITSAAITLAAQGLQYAFLLIFVSILSCKFPKILKEKFTPLILTQKIFAIFLIGVGLVILAVNNL